jgi:hypothetical protein
MNFVLFHPLISEYIYSNSRDERAIWNWISSEPGWLALYPVARPGDSYKWKSIKVCTHGIPKIPDQVDHMIECSGEIFIVPGDDGSFAVGLDVVIDQFLLGIYFQ